MDADLVNLIHEPLEQQVHSLIELILQCRTTLVFQQRSITQLICLCRVVVVLYNCAVDFCLENLWANVGTYLIPLYRCFCISAIRCLVSLHLARMDYGGVVHFIRIEILLRRHAKLRILDLRQSLDFVTFVFL